jgi:hypothetical protein
MAEIIDTMGRDLYSCTGCKKTFGRRYNAERHNKQVHDEMAVVYDNKTNRISAKRTIASKKASIAGPNSMDKGEKANRFNIDSLKTRYSESSTDKDNDDEEKISNVFGKMLPLLEEIESLLSDTPPAERKDTVGQIIMTSLMTSNPFKAMRDAINFHNSIKGTKKASYLVAAWKNISPVQAQELLRSTIMNAPYFKRKLDYNISRYRNN